MKLTPIACSLLLSACLEPNPRYKSPTDTSTATFLPSDVSDCWWALLCLQAAKPDLEDQLACHAQYPDVAKQAAEALYFWVIYGWGPKLDTCFLGETHEPLR